MDIENSIAIKSLFEDLSDATEADEGDINARLSTLGQHLNAHGIRNPLHLKKQLGSSLADPSLHALAARVGRNFCSQQSRVDAEAKTLDEYNTVLTQMEGEDWLTFMNHGFAPTSEGELSVFPFINKRDQQWLHQVYLYLFLVLGMLSDRHKKKTAQSSLLDIGCGRGGGLRALVDYCNFKNGVGVDLNPKHIEFATRAHTVDRLKFVTGSALELPFDDSEFEIATNVESSHLYGDLIPFFTEVARVLRPGGLLLLADTRMPLFGEALLDSQIGESDFLRLAKRDITPNVIAACHLDKDGLGAGFGSRKIEFPRRIAAHKEREYASGWSSYFIYVLQKPN